jgi:hypothetical protein
VTLDFFGAASAAEVIFLGKITNVERVPEYRGEHVVTFKVETWWKGKPSPDTRVLWRPSEDPECGFLPVGEVGEDYLVYADPSRKINPRDRHFPVVTTFNRTSRLPANLKPESFVIDWSKQTRISPTPILNRADGSDDIELLRALRGSGCLSTWPAPPFDLQPSIQSNARQAEGVSACRTCMRVRVKPFVPY